MKHAALLDCTLRDGAYLLDKKFGEETIRGIIDGLVKSRVDFIEIGFFQDEGSGIGKTVFHDAEEAQNYIPAHKQGCKFTVLADCSRYSVENLTECTGLSVDAVRECFFKEEQEAALNKCRRIKEKGYLLFVQPVDILGYSDIELIKLIEQVNKLEPYCFSIVDTFGSMYQESLHRVFELVNHNLIKSCKMGFHSHNNLQLSSALSQEFIRMAVGKREVIVDGTLDGMGRGAGNTPTELIAQYLVSQMGYEYDIDAILDVLDGYMDNIRTRCTWGYTTQYFVAGCFDSHVNNISYLSRKNSVRSKDIRYILNKIGPQARKRYDYDLLEKTYEELIYSDIDDQETLKKLREYIGRRPVLVLVPGSSATLQTDRIRSYIAANQPVIISVNFIHDQIKPDFVYMSNVKRYQYWKNNKEFMDTKKIVTSNIDVEECSGVWVISFIHLLKCGWPHSDNSTIMLLRLLDLLDVSEIAIAGFDGYDSGNEKKSNYATEAMELLSLRIEPEAMNKELMEILTDYNRTRIHRGIPIRFVTNSRFEVCFQEER